MLPYHYRPQEEALVNRERQAEELAALAAAIKKATLMCSKDKQQGKRTAAYFLAWRLGMSQREIAEMAGISKQAVEQRIKRFGYWLRVAYRRPD